MKRVFTAVLAALTAVLLIPAPAGAAQLSAGEWPTFSGPVAAGEKACSAKRDKSRSGRTIAILKVCAYPFALQSSAESDETNDYGAIWVQSHVIPRNDYCVRSVNTDIELESDMPVLSTSPPSRTLTQKRTVRVRLRLDAQGAVEGDEGEIKNSFVMHPGSLTRRDIVDDDAGTRLLRLKWSGNTGRKLAFVSGAEVSWPAAESTSFRYGLEYRPGRRNTC